MSRAAPAVLGLLVTAAAWPAEPDPAALIDHGHVKQARALLDARLRAHTDDAGALVQMARVKLVYGDDEGAKALLQKAIALEPKNSSAHLVLADAYSRRVDEAGMFEKIKIAKAIHSETDAALAADPENLSAMEALMSFYLQAPGVMGGSSSKAREMADRIMARDRVRGNFARAEIASHERRYDEIEGFYRSAAEADPKSFEAWVGLASVYLSERSRNHAKAEESARKALAVDPGRAEPYVILTQVYVTQDRWTDLDPLLALAEKNLPESLVSHYMAGRSLLTQGKDPARAEAAFRKYLTLQEPEGGAPPLAAAHWRLGQALEKQGKREEAIREIETAVKLKPDLKDAQNDLKRLRS